MPLLAETDVVVLVIVAVSWCVSANNDLIFSPKDGKVATREAANSTGL